jgi:uncharacterized protein YegL
VEVLVYEGPGGRLASRPLHFIWILDASGSMASLGKIQALNNAIREVIPHMREAAEDQPHAEVLVRALAFSDGARWIVPEPTPVHEFVWTNLESGGVTDLGAALVMVGEQLEIPPMSDRALPPVLVLVSDGQPTDDFDSGMRRLLASPWGSRALRVAIGIGRDADYEVLKRFIGSGDLQPLEAHSPEQLLRYVRWASTAVRAVSQPKGDAIDHVARAIPDGAQLRGADEVTW